MENIPLASPYPWTMTEEPLVVSKKPRTVSKGTGLLFLQEKLRSGGGIRNSQTRLILSKLLPDCFEDNEDDDEEYESPRRKFSTAGLFNKERSKLRYVDSSHTDDEMLQMALDKNTSLLASILALFGKDTRSLSAKGIIRSCLLVVNPGNVPGHMDAREYVLAALNFLASSSDGEISLPLIVPLQHQDDPEKRVYQKASSWEMKPAMFRKINCLETVFARSPLPPLGRKKFCPSLSLAEEPPLLMKGVIPPRASVKRKGTAGIKRKSVTPVAVAENHEEVQVSVFSG